MSNDTVLYLIEACAMVRVSFCPPLRTPAVQRHVAPFLKTLHSREGPGRSTAASLGAHPVLLEFLALCIRLLLVFEVVQASSRASSDAAAGTKSGA